MRAITFVEKNLIKLLMQRSFPQLDLYLIQNLSFGDKFLRQVKKVTKTDKITKNVLCFATAAY